MRHHTLAFLLSFTLLSPAVALEDRCATAMSGGELPAFPREIDSQKTFEALVQWVHDDLIVARGAPGLVVGLSGTDSIVAFLVIAKAYEKAGRADRVAGVHYGPSEEWVDDHPEAASHLWFSKELVPWLQKQAPRATLVVDTSLDWRLDGMRWGALMDWSVLANRETRALRPKHEQYWVVGTRNATEEALFTYSNASMAASVQILSHLWKSEILRLSRWLGVPEIALDKSCEVDCVCGRMRLPAQNVPEVDALLMVRQGQLAPSYVERTLPPLLRHQLEQFIETQIAASSFKASIPYVAAPTAVHDEADAFHSLDQVRARLASGSADVRILSRWVPQLIAQGRSNLAADLVTTPAPRREHFIPEALALFRTPGLRPGQLRQMLTTFFSALPAKLTDADVRAVAKVNGRLGALGFHFPQWRLLAERAGGRALAEDFGMQRRERPNDVRNAALPAADPGRDELGQGFIHTSPTQRIEYRRAYATCTLHGDQPVTVVVRNSSHFFGRDRLAHAVYVSFATLTDQELDGLDGDFLEKSGKFFSWPQVFVGEAAVEPRLQRVEAALNALGELNQAMSRWLESPPGAAALAAFVQRRAVARAKVPPIYVAVVQGDDPSWAPKSVMALTATFPADALPRPGPGERLVLLSGAHGDLP